MNITVSRFHIHRTVITDDAIFSISGTDPLWTTPMGRVVLKYGSVKILKRNPIEDVAHWRTFRREIRCMATDLPPELIRDPRWPKTKVNDGVLIVPRVALIKVKVTWLRGLVLKVKPPGPKILLVGLSPWDTRKVRKHLAAAAYPGA